MGVKYAEFNLNRAIERVKEAIYFTRQLQASEDTLYTMLKLEEALKKLEELK